MIYFARNLALMGLTLALPVSIYAQQPSGESDKTKQPGQVTVSVESLMGSKVLDQNNKQVGTVKNIMIDPSSGKISTADIGLGGEGFLGVGGRDDRVSVPWEQFSVKRQDGSLVLVMNQTFIDQVQANQTKKQPGQSRSASVEDIRKAEQALQAKGFNPGPVDGQLDSQSQQALSEFQKQNSLKATGSLDQQTAEKLGIKLGAQSSQQQPGK